MRVHANLYSNVGTTKNNPETAPTNKDDEAHSSDKLETGAAITESVTSNPAEGGDTKGTVSKRKAQSPHNADDDDDKVDPELAAYVLVVPRLKPWCTCDKGTFLRIRK